METRFFEIQKVHHNGYKSGLCPTNDFLILDILENSKKIYDFGDTVLVHAIIPGYCIKSMQEQTELENPMTRAGLIKLGILDIYRGENYNSYSYSGLFSYFPQLKGTKKVKVDAVSYTVDKLTRHRWGA